jgi:hypothetical protein
VVGAGQERNATAQEKLEDLSTAAGGGGGGGVGGVTGFAGGPGRFGRFTTPSLANLPVTRPPPPPIPVTASANVASRVYDGTTAAALSGAAFTTPVINISLVNDLVGAFVSPNAGAAVSVNTFMSITGPDVALYNFRTPTLVGTITARPIQLMNPLVTSMEYNGTTSFSATRLLGAADLNNIVGSQQLNVTGNGTITGTADVGTGKFANMTYLLGNGANGGLAGNYLPLADDSILIDITEKTLSYANPSASAKVYDGTANATVTLGGVGRERNPDDHAQRLFRGQERRHRQGRHREFCPGRRIQRREGLQLPPEQPQPLRQHHGQTGRRGHDGCSDQQSLQR